MQPCAFAPPSVHVYHLRGQKNAHIPANAYIPKAILFVQTQTLTPSQVEVSVYMWVCVCVQQMYQNDKKGGKKGRGLK